MGDIRITVNINNKSNNLVNIKNKETSDIDDGSCKNQEEAVMPAEYCSTIDKQENINREWKGPRGLAGGRTWLVQVVSFLWDIRLV